MHNKFSKVPIHLNLNLWKSHFGGSGRYEAGSSRPETRSQKKYKAIAHHAYWNWHCYSNSHTVCILCVQVSGWTPTRYAYYECKQVSGWTPHTVCILWVCTGFWLDTHTVCIIGRCTGFLLDTHTVCILCVYTSFWLDTHTVCIQGGCTSFWLDTHTVCIQGVCTSFWLDTHPHSLHTRRVNKFLVEHPHSPAHQECVQVSGWTPTQSVHSVLKCMYKFLVGHPSLQNMTVKWVNNVLSSLKSW